MGTSQGIKHRRVTPSQHSPTRGSRPSVAPLDPGSPYVGECFESATHDGMRRLLDACHDVLNDRRSARMARTNFEAARLHAYVDSVAPRTLSTLTCMAHDMDVMAHELAIAKGAACSAGEALRARDAELDAERMHSAGLEAELNRANTLLAIARGALNDTGKGE